MCAFLQYVFYKTIYGTCSKNSIYATYTEHTVANTCIVILDRIFLECGFLKLMHSNYCTLLKWLLFLKIENNSSWVNFTHFREKTHFLILEFRIFKNYFNIIREYFKRNSLQFKHLLNSPEIVIKMLKHFLFIQIIIIIIIIKIDLIFLIIYFQSLIFKFS